MNESADNLFAQLGGISSAAANEPEARETQKPIAGMSDQDESHDNWRILLVELAYLLNASFRDAHYWEGVKAEKDTFRQFVRVVRELNRMPGNDRIINIQFRGSQSSKYSDKIDYVITFGDVTIDMPAIAVLTKRMGLRVKHLEGRLQKSFEAFEQQGIKTLFVKIPEGSEDSMEPMQVALRVLACFNHAVENETPIVFARNGDQFSLPPIADDMNQPDPNLTMLAALNGLSPESMRNLVDKVQTAMKGQNPAVTDGQASNIYQSIFQIQALRQKLVHPPLEMNSDKSSAVQTDQTGRSASMAANAGGAGSGHPGPGFAYPIDPGVVKARVAQFVKQSFGDSPQNARKALKSIYGRDFAKITDNDLVERLTIVTDLLHSMEKNPRGPRMMQEVLGRMQLGMDQAAVDLFDDFVVDGKGVKYWSDKGEKTVDNVDKRLLSVVEAARQKSVDKKKNRMPLDPTAVLSEQDLESIAGDFDIPVKDVDKIVATFRNCFDSQNNFLRASFEKNVPEFARCKKKVFDILWEFLKQTPHRSDRLPFINSLQFLIRETKNPISAIKVLLSDIIMDPGSVQYPDRNAVMLANQFLRTYNKEKNMDIEITPEEVLLVQEGLDVSVVNYAKWKVDSSQKVFFDKFITIRKKLIESLDIDSTDSHHLPIRFLLALEREIHIFLSLVGGTAAHTVIKGALTVYGNPGSQVYLMKESQNNMTALLQHLAVLIRGFGRLSTVNDLELLNEVKNNEDGFLALGNDARHEALVKRILGWVDASKNSITARSSKEASEQ
ncbi:MAG: hypothetical protein JRF72_11720 [Deltaproteobacteria bacterium]|nr:hypothetical protein [Deltaproteobacteria bacterium]